MCVVFTIKLEPFENLLILPEGWRKYKSSKFWVINRNFVLEECYIQPGKALEMKPTFLYITDTDMGFPGGSMVKNPLSKEDMWLWSLGQEDPLDKEIAIYSTVLAWEIQSGAC